MYCPLKKWKQCEGNSCLWPGSGGGVVATPPEAAIYNIQPPARPNANHPTRAPPILCGSIPALLRVVYIPVALMPIIGSNPCHFCTPLPRPLTTLKGLQKADCTINRMNIAKIINISITLQLSSRLSLSQTSMLLKRMRPLKEMLLLQMISCKTKMSKVCKKSQIKIYSTLKLKKKRPLEPI